MLSVAKPSKGVYTVGFIAVKALCWGSVPLGGTQHQKCFSPKLITYLSRFSLNSASWSGLSPANSLG